MCGATNCLLLLIIPLTIHAQIYDNYQTAYKFQPPQFNDPIRRALGLWSRLLNRMSQTNEPTDDQLHLRVADGEKSAFDDLPSLFGNLLQRRDKNARLPPIQSTSNSIINEERLNQLLPRTRQEQIGIEETKTTTEPRIIKDNSLEEQKTTIKSTTVTMKASKKPKKITNPPVSLEQNDASQSDESENTSSAERESGEEELKRMKTKKPVTSTSRSVKKELRVENGVVRKALKEERPIKSTTTKKHQIIKHRTTIRFTTFDDNDKKVPISTTPISTTPISTKKSKPSIITVENDDIETGSGQEPIKWFDEEELLTTRATQRTRKPKTTTKRITTTKTTKKVTTSTPPTTILKWKSQKSARKNTELIPEAEEAEFQTDDQPITTTSAAEQTIKHDHSHNYSEESQENEKKMDKIMTPVSSIIDGIGPLILPLLGYSRQTIGGILNPPVVPASNARVSGVRNFRPQQVPTNAQIVRSPSPRDALSGRASFQEIMAPFKKQQSAFQQAPVSQKSYGPKQAQLKNHRVETVSSPSADYLNRNGIDTSSSFVQNENFAIPVGEKPTFNRMVNAVTAQRYIPDPPNIQANQVDQGLLEAYRQILTQRGLNGPSLHGINEDQLAQVAQVAAKMPKNETPFIGINAPAKLPVPEIRRQPSVDDPGYQMGRSSVVSSFYEDSGLMVGTKPSGAPPAEEKPQEGSSAGFGGGRRPDSSFEQAALNTVEDERLFR